jgi:hypothetical protein
MDSGQLEVLAGKRRHEEARGSSESDGNGSGVEGPLSVVESDGKQK